MKLLAVGEAVIDFTPYTDGNTYIQNFGGAPANVCLAFSRMGLDAAFGGMVGDDLFGDFLIQTMQENGIGTDGIVKTDKAVTTMTFVSLTRSGDREFVFVRKPGADMFYQCSDLPKSDLESASIYHFCSLMLTQANLQDIVSELIMQAQRDKKLVSFDMNHRKNIWPEDAAKSAVSKILDSIDLLKLSDDEALLLSGERSLEEALSYFENRGHKLVAITCGIDGAYCLHNGMREFHKGFPELKTIDTTGAGDAFWGTLLGVLCHESQEFTQISRQQLRQALIYANAAGGLTTTRKGVLEAIPNKERLEKFVCG